MSLKKCRKCGWHYLVTSRVKHVCPTVEDPKTSTKEKDKSDNNDKKR